MMIDGEKGEPEKKDESIESDTAESRKSMEEMMREEDLVMQTHRLLAVEQEDSVLTEEQDARVVALFHAKALLSGRNVKFGSTSEPAPDANDLVLIADYIIVGSIGD